VASVNSVEPDELPGGIHPRYRGRVSSGVSPVPSPAGCNRRPQDRPFVDEGEKFGKTRSVRSLCGVRIRSNHPVPGRIGEMHRKASYKLPILVFLISLGLALAAGSASAQWDGKTAKPSDPSGGPLPEDNGGGDPDNPVPMDGSGGREPRRRRSGLSYVGDGEETLGGELLPRSTITGCSARSSSWSRLPAYDAEGRGSEQDDRGRRESAHSARARARAARVRRRPPNVSRASNASAISTRRRPIPARVPNTTSRTLA
jgi:hypothetical protein